MNNSIEIISNIPATNLQTLDGMRQGIPFKNGYSVGHRITGINHHTSRSTTGIQRQHSLTIKKIV